MTVGHWRAPKAVVYNNSPIYSHNCVLSKWGSWLRVDETL
jgi:hypothetical protein